MNVNPLTRGAFPLFWLALIVLCLAGCTVREVTIQYSAVKMAARKAAPSPSTSPGCATPWWLCTQAGTGTH